MTLKKHLTLGKVATVCAAASGLMYHYWFKRRKTRTITINGQAINVSALNLELSNYQDVHAEIQRGNYSTLGDFDHNPLNHVAVDTDGNELFGFRPHYTLDDNFAEQRLVSLIYNKKLGQMHLPWNWSCLCCSNTEHKYITTQNTLAAALYNSTVEDETKVEYAEQLHVAHLSNHSKIAALYRSQPKTDATIRQIEAHELRNEMLRQKHSRVLGID